MFYLLNDKKIIIVVWSIAKKNMASFANIGTLFCSLILLLVFTADNSSVFACSGGGDSTKVTDDSTTSKPPVKDTTDNTSDANINRIFNTGCQYDEFDCNDNSGCYTEAQKCDGTAHCTDNTDEDSHHCGMVW